MSTFGERIAEVRKETGLSQTDFGALGGVGKHTQINYEKGERYPDANYLFAISSRVDVVYVLTGKRASTYLPNFMVEENQPSPYTPAKRAAATIAALTFSEADADILVSLALRLNAI